MKKFIALLLSAAMLAAGAVTLTSCGGADDAPEPSPSAALSPEPTASEPAASESAASTQTNGETAQNSDEQKENVPSNNEISSEEISIINGTSVDFYALYLSANTSGNLGENIINGSTFGEGEELILPYANLDTSQSLNLIVEDESGKRYIIEDFPISNGAVIEIRLNGNTLEAFVQ